MRILPYIVGKLSEVRLSKMRSNRADGKRGRVMCDNCEHRAECEANEDFICPADESDDMWAITQGD